MREGIRLFKVFGIEISLDLSWFIVFFLFAWALASEYFPGKIPLLNTGTYWMMGLISSLLLFITVLLHELSHSLVANQNGLNISKIKLFIFGGVAQLNKEPQSARVEFDVAIAGPTCSFVLHFIFLGIALMLSPVMPSGDQSPLVAMLMFLSFINVFLGIINLLPAYPLDGGRVLRAFLWARTKNLKKATAVVSNIGKFFAVFIIFMGFMATIGGNLWGLWYVFIGMFLFGAARMGYENILIKDALTGSYVNEVMTTDVVTINSDLTLDEVVVDYFFRYHHNSFPVVSSGSVIGILELSKIKEIQRENWKDTLVKDAMRPVESYEIVRPKAKTSSVLSRFAEHELEHIFVMQKDVLFGIITRRDIMKLLKLKMDLGG